MSGIPTRQFISYYERSLSGGTVTSGKFWKQVRWKDRHGQADKGLQSSLRPGAGVSLEGGDCDLLAGHRTQDTFLTGEAAVPFSQGTGHK